MKENDTRLSCRDEDSIKTRIEKTTERIEKIKGFLLSGKNQKKLTQAETMLSKRRRELEEANDKAAEENEREAERTRENILRLESTAKILRKRLALLKEEHERLMEASRKTADSIIALESEGSDDAQGERELNIKLKSSMGAAADMKAAAARLEKELNTADLDILRQRARLRALEEYRPLSVETDKRYTDIEKELAYRTARRDHLLERYSEELKTLDKLNCTLYGMSLARKRNENIDEMKRLNA